MGTKKQSPTTTDSERPVPRRVEALQAAWGQFRNHLRVADVVLANCDDAVRKAAPDEYTREHYSRCFDTVKSEEATKVAEDLIEMVIREARAELAPVGAKLEIKREDVKYAPRYRQYHEPKDNLDELNLVEVFQSLAVQFGGHCGIERAAADAAKQLYDTLSHQGHWFGDGDKRKQYEWAKQLDDGELWQHASIQSYQSQKPPVGYNKYDYGVPATLHTTLVALASMCAIRHESFVGTHTPALAVQDIGGDRMFKYGQKIEVSDDLTLVCRKDKIEYRCSKRLCHAIKDFVAINLFKPVTVPDDGEADASR